MEKEDKIISLKCPSCGANLTVEKNFERYFCNYCGAEFEVDLSDDVRIESIRAEASKEIEEGKRKVEQEKIKAINERIKRKEEKDSINEFKKGKALKIIIGMLIVIGIASWMAFINSAPLAGMLALVQIALLVLALLNGFRIFRPNNQNYYVLFMILTAVLILVFFWLQQHSM